MLMNSRAHQATIHQYMRSQLKLSVREMVMRRNAHKEHIARLEQQSQMIVLLAISVGKGLVQCHQQ